MESKLVAQPTGSDSLVVTYTAQFEQVFPYYLAIGMTPEQFWDGDSTLAEAYRKAFSIRQELQNQQAWLQGMYVYEAICDVAPILRALSKATKPQPYSKQPYTLQNTTSISQQRKEESEKINDNKAKDMLSAFAVRWNKKFEERQKQERGE